MAARLTRSSTASQSATESEASALTQASLSDAINARGWESSPVGLPCVLRAFLIFPCTIFLGKAPDGPEEGNDETGHDRVDSLRPQCSRPDIHLATRHPVHHRPHQ